MSDDQGLGTSPEQDTAQTPRFVRPRWLTWPAVSATCAIILVLLAVFGGSSYFNSLFERINTLTDRIDATGRKIPDKLGEKLEKQTDAIRENTKGLAVLEERVKGVEKQVGDLKQEVEKDMDRLEKKIDNLSIMKKARY